MEPTNFLLLLLALQLSSSLSLDCPQYYTGYSGHCYRVSSQKLNFTDARQACQSEGADLVSVNNQGEDDFLKGKIGTSGRDYWIGMLYTSGGYQWFDGTGVAYTNWYINNPDCMTKTTGTPCAAMYSDFTKYQWEDLDINYQEYYICEFIPAIPTTTVASKADCSQHYTKYSGHCYRISSREASWTDARQVCQSEGGDLISVNDQGEDDFLKGKIRSTSRYYWLGMVYMQAHGRYEWLDGTEVGYTDWAPKEPSCMSIINYNCKPGYSYHFNFKWEDYNDIKSYYICEKLPTVMSTVSSKTDLQAVIHLECQHQGWYVTVNLDKLSRSPSDVSEIYMNEDTCVGTLQGGLLVFNKTYQECNTQAQVTNTTVTYSNNLLYATRDSNNIIRDLRWKEDLHCSHGYHASNTVNIKPDITQQGSSSGLIPGSPVDIKLYTDSAFSQPLQGTVKLGTPVYVQVLSLGHPDVAMVVQSCNADIKSSSSQNLKPRPLIQHHCSVEPSTNIIVVRNQVTRFRFNMFDLPNDQDHDGIFVTCNVVFWDPMDFSSQCEQTCKSSSTIIG